MKEVQNSQKTDNSAQQEPLYEPIFSFTLKNKTQNDLSLQGLQLDYKVQKLQAKVSSYDQNGNSLTSESDQTSNGDQEQVVQWAEGTYSPFKEKNLAPKKEILISIPIKVKEQLNGATEEDWNTKFTNFNTISISVSLKSNSKTLFAPQIVRSVSSLWPEKNGEKNSNEKKRRGSFYPLKRVSNLIRKKIRKKS